MSSPEPTEEELAAVPAHVKRYLWRRRRRLPTRRRDLIQKLRITDATGTESKVFVIEGLYPDGTLAELAIKLHKEGATLRAMLDGVGIAVSHGLQHGVPLATYVEAYAYTRFEPAGLVEGHPHITECTSILDLVFRHLGVTHLGRMDLLQPPPQHLARWTDA